MFADNPQWPQGLCVGSSGHDYVTSSKGKPNRLGSMRGHGAGCPRVRAVLIVRWIRCALRSRTFGTPPARVHSGENVCSINLRQSTMVISFRPSAFQLERSQGAERLLLTAAKKSLKDRESTRHASVKIIKHLIFEDQTGGGTEWFP